MKHYEYEKKYHSIVKKLWAHKKSRGVLLPGAPDRASIILIL